MCEILCCIVIPDNMKNVQLFSLSIWLCDLGLNHAEGARRFSYREELAEVNRATFPGINIGDARGTLSLSVLRTPHNSPSGAGENVQVWASLLRLLHLPQPQIKQKKQRRSS